MITLPAKPINSTIEVQNDFNSVSLSWKNPRGGWSRFATLIFLLGWMGGWFVGEVSAIRSILSGDPNLFIIFWVIAWSAGGVFAAAMIFKLARPSRRESIVLDMLYLFHDPGTEPLSSFNKSDGNLNALDLLRPRQSHRFAKKEIGEIRLERIGERQRLSIDHGAKRIELGTYLEEPEREWLYSVLKSWKST